MSAFEGILQTPKANEATHKKIKSLKIVTMIMFGNIFFSILFLAFVLDHAHIDRRIIAALIAVEVVVMGLLVYSMRKRTERLVAVVDRVRGQEVLFFSDYAEFAATLFTEPNPTRALAAQHPYLKIHFRDIESVKTLDSRGKTPAAFIIRLMNDRKVVLLREAFAGAETQFLDALNSHGVTLPISGH